MGNWQYFISNICIIYQHFPPVFYESIYSWDEYLWMDSMEQKLIFHETDFRDNKETS